MSLFGPVTNVDLRIWQLSSAHLLRELMDRAHAEELPPVAWTVPVLGGLVAHCAKPEEWQAWLDALQLADVRPALVHGGRVRLRATGRAATARGRQVSVAILADYQRPDRPTDAA